MAKFNELFEKVGRKEERTQDMSKIKELCTGLENGIKNFGKEVKWMKEANEQNEQDIDNLYRENAKLRFRARETDQYSKKENVIIHGIPPVNREKTRELVIEWADKLGIRLREYEIRAAHREQRPSSSG